MHRDGANLVSSVSILETLSPLVALHVLRGDIERINFMHACSILEYLEHIELFSLVFW